MTTDVWTTSAHRAPARFEAWRHALNLSHLEWELEPAPEPTFGARIRQKTLDGVRVVDCHCDPCAGWRRRPQVSRMSLDSGLEPKQPLQVSGCRGMMV